MDLPRQLGPYRLIRRLGHGGMAEVFLALAFGASGFEKKVALKTLLPELHGEGDFERILVEEARLAASLVHKNLVQVHDLGVAGGTYYVRMDWVDGGDLGTLARGEALPAPLALYVAEELALALDYLHRVADDEGRALGLVHRDVSPSNILLSREGEVKLADFGIAKATARVESTQGRVPKGKYAYMSPEQVTGARLSARSDQFGLGVTLLEMLTGRRPFDGDTPLATMDKIREGTLPDLGDLADDLAALATRCLAREADARFDDTEALRAAIARCRHAREPAAAPELARWVRAR